MLTENVHRAIQPYSDIIFHERELGGQVPNECSVALRHIYVMGFMWGSDVTPLLNCAGAWSLSCFYNIPFTRYVDMRQ